MAVTVRPETAEKCLRLVAAFEGHGGGYAAGNYDNQVLTWGQIGHALRSGSLYFVLRRILELDPAALPAALAGALRQGKQATIAFVLDHVLRSDVPSKVRPDWQAQFVALYHLPAAQQAFREAADRYLRKAAAIAHAMNLRSERGFALALDVAVQNGSIRFRAVPIWRRIRLEYRARLDHPTEQEWVRMKALAFAIADVAIPRWRNDVLERKLTIATGQGRVHGRFYVLDRDYGIDYSQAWEVVA